MTELYYVQDSRDHAYVGDGLSFWAQGGGYVTDLAKAEVFTRDEAVAQNQSRETDIPWLKAYIDARAHRGVDCQVVHREDVGIIHDPDTPCFMQMKRQWNGNDLIWVRWPAGTTPDLSKAFIATHATALQLIENAGINAEIWPIAYIRRFDRSLVHRGDVNIKEALKGTGIVLAKPFRQSHRKADVYNCEGCGRFVGGTKRYLEDCQNCGADNRP